MASQMTGLSPIGNTGNKLHPLEMSPLTKGHSLWSAQGISHRTSLVFIIYKLEVTHHYAVHASSKANYLF